MRRRALWFLAIPLGMAAGAAALFNALFLSAALMVAALLVLKLTEET